MIKAKAIYPDKFNWSDRPIDVSTQALEDFINQVGYDNVKQILMSQGAYTVIYEE